MRICSELSYDNWEPPTSCMQRVRVTGLVDQEFSRVTTLYDKFAAQYFG